MKHDYSTFNKRMGQKNNLSAHSPIRIFAHSHIRWIIISIFLMGTSFIQFGKTNQATPLVLTEFMADNNTSLTDEDGDYSDWIEIYNRSQYPVNLGNWALTDDYLQPQKWLFPDIMLASHEYMVIFASGKGRSEQVVTSTSSTLNSAHLTNTYHTNFKLHQDGEFLGLYHLTTDKFTHLIQPQYPPQFTDCSYGQYGESFAYLETPTPGQPNQVNMAWFGLTSPVIFSQQRGFYDHAFTVTLTTAMPQTVVYYTTDGSEPSATNGEQYLTPILVDRTILLRAIALKSDFLPSSINTHSYIFLDEIIQQPASPPNTPASWGVYMEFYPNLPPKDSPVPANYEMDQRVVQDERYRDTIKDDLRSIPSVSIVTDPKNFDIYVYARREGVEWERPASIEWIVPQGMIKIDKTGETGKTGEIDKIDETGFQINAGLRMQGRHGRWEFMPKHSLRFFFKGIYGATKLNYPVFPDSPVQSFDTLILRAGSNRSYAGYIRPYDYRLVTYARDEWTRASQVAVSGVGSHGTFVHVYLNGLYWGLYNVVERPDHAFAASYLGGDKEDWSVIKHGYKLLDEDTMLEHGELASGSRARYDEMYALVDQAGLTDPEKYAAFSQYLDIPYFIDYLIVNWYTGNNDWIENNWYVLSHGLTGKLKFFVWDAERAWGDGAMLYMAEESHFNRIGPMLDALMENSDFRLEFADRVYKNLFHDGPLTDANSQARWARITNYIERAVVGESARWGDTRYVDDPVIQEDWLWARDKVSDQIDGNSAKLIKLLRESGYYPTIDPPEFSRQGGVIDSGFSLTISTMITSDTPDTKTAADTLTATPDTIYFTINGSDPRLPQTGQVNNHAMIYNDPILITKTTHIKARILAYGHWSALNEAVFRVGQAKPQIQITEIMYNPIEGGDYEFIGLKNVGNVEINLSHLYFEGIEFSFPASQKTFIPGEFIVLVRNAQAFAKKYPHVAITGVYDGQLSNQGETISVKDKSGNILATVAYDDQNGWPLSADGQGDSIVIINPLGETNNPANWQSSGF